MMSGGGPVGSLTVMGTTTMRHSASLALCLALAAGLVLPGNAQLAPPAPPSVPAAPSPPAPPAVPQPPQAPQPPANPLEELAAAIPGIAVRYDRLNIDNDRLVAEGVTFVRKLPGGGTDETQKLYIKRIEASGLDQAAFKTVFDPNAYAGATDETFRTLIANLTLTELSVLVEDKPVLSVAAWILSGLEMKQFPFVPGGPEFMQQFLSRDLMGIQMAGGFLDSLKVGSIQMNGVRAEFDPAAFADSMSGASTAPGMGGPVTYEIQEARQETVDRGRFGRVSFRGFASTSALPMGRGEFRFSMADGYWDGGDFSKLVPYMIKAEWPPVSREPLISYGKGCVNNYDFSLTGIGALNVPAYCVEAIPFVWLIPQSIEMSILGTFTPAPAGEFLAPPYIARHFTGPMPVEIQIAAAYDPDLGTASISHYRIRLGGFGEVDWMGTAGGLPLDGLTSLPETMGAGISFVGAGVRVVDEGGVQKFLEMAADASNPPGQTQVTPDALKLQAKAGLDMAVGMLGATPQAVAVVDAIKAFIDGGGTLEITANPPVPLTSADFDALAAKPPAEILSALGLSATRSAP